MIEITKNYIAGKWEEAEGGRIFENRNPADTDEIVGVVTRSAREDVDRAVKAAESAFIMWRMTPAPRRGEILFRAGEMLAARKGELAELETREMGKVLSETLGDVQEAIDLAWYMGSEGRRLSGETVPSELPNKDCRSVRVPLGVCSLITPWNFPMALPALKVFPALVCGNAVVFKPSSYTSLSAARLVGILEEAGLPPGVLNLVHGRGEEIGEYLATHPGIEGLSFTGSTAVGRVLAGKAVGKGKRVSCEMGGKNAIIVMDDARLDLAVEGAVWAGFGTAGQRCTAASRLVVHEAVYERFLDMFIAAVSRLRLGNGLDRETDVGPLVSREQVEKVLGYIEIGKEEGAKVLTGGKARREGQYARGHFVEPTVFDGVDPRMRIAQEEIFGPVVAVLKARDLSDAIEIVNGTPYGLVASIYTRDVNNSAIAERELDTGIVYINASTTGAEIQLPFGGTKASGIGYREGGGMGGALDMFTKWKIIFRDFSGRLQRAQIDR
ncbi:MAG TPA: aldehyde dehydrogenase family protein [Thermodesulfovibrionales bacterium]|nr:aldehyde dehydrogenase family protein [Thermodesulfovibrionales bacterium]